MAAGARTIAVVGIGYRPLDRMASDRIIGADLVFSSPRLTSVFSRYREFPAVAERITVLSSVDETLSAVRRAFPSRDVAVLAAGDPLFFGIGSRMASEFGKEAIDIFPDLSCVSVAFSRIKEPQDNAFIVGLHHGPDPARARRLPYDLGDIAGLVRDHGLVAVLTDREKSPAMVAEALLRSDPVMDEAVLWVCERLGYPDERIVRGRASVLAREAFAEPHLVIVKHAAGHGRS